MRTACVVALLLASALPLHARKKDKQADTLTTYVARVSTRDTGNSYMSPGSLWTDSGALASLATDYKARRVGDVVVVQIVEQVTATNASNVNTQRKFDTTSSITGVAGKINTGGLAPLFAANSATNLQGQGQAATKTSIRTSVGGRVIAVLPSGNMVIEARREATANNERQTVFLRGVARPGDVTPDNTVLSTQLSDLEVELKGHGVISDATRPPNWIVRTILKVLGF